MYDLLIKGGRVVDSAENIDDKLDIAISKDKIALIAKDVSASESRQVVNAGNKIVTAGLIDLHTHVYAHFSKICAEPDTVGVEQGVTTLADGGTAGQAIFGGFPRYIIPSSRTTVFCFLHLSSQGLTVMPELRDWSEIDVDATLETIEANRQVIKGVKLRLVGNLVASEGVKVIAMAKDVAKRAGLPIMVHIGDVKKQVPATLTRELLRVMEPGDILSHVFTGQSGGILDTSGKVLPELREAAQRGVVLEIAHGGRRNCSTGNFSFEVARRGMEQGILPTVISTDISPGSTGGPVYSLTVTMSKFLALGLELRQIIEMSTINPARALGIDGRAGSLRVGKDADISVLDILTGTWKLEDSEQKALEVTKLIAPVITVKAGQLITAQPAVPPQPID